MTQLRIAAIVEVDDQPALTEVFDFEIAKSACPSFEKCHRELMKPLQQVAAITPGFQPDTP